MLFLKLKDKEKKIEAHIRDLRKYIFFALIIFLIIFGICCYFSKDIYNFLSAPLIKVLVKYDYYEDPFIITSLTEGIFTYIKTAFFSAAIIFIPILLYQVIFYLTPVFNKNKKDLYIILGIIAPFLFYLGIIFAYFCTFFIVWNFLVVFNLKGDFTFYLKISEYLNLSLSIILWFGVSFELPVILYILAKLGIINYGFLKKFRKIAILIAFVVAAILTPPDPISQIIMAIILITLYEISVFFIKRYENKLNKITK